MKRRFVALLLAYACACAPNRGAAYARSLNEARSAYHDGHFGAAALKFEAASAAANLPRDAVYARYEAALAWIRDGDIAKGAAELRAIASTVPPNDYSAEAALKAAMLARASDEERGLLDLEHVVLTFPAHGVASVALGQLLRHDDETSAQAALDRLERLTARFENDRKTATKRDETAKLDERLHYERARRLDTAGRTREAYDALLAVATRWPYPFGSYFDDSLFRAAQIARRLGLVPDALAHLQRLLDAREVASFMGSYERPRYVPALLEMVDIYATTGERKKARAALHTLYSDFKTSPLRDEALWREALLWEADGDPSTACARLKTLASEFPDSRYVPCATIRCPSVARNAKSRAPATCHAYLVRPPPDAAND
jgi:hypothetical protein